MANMKRRRRTPISTPRGGLYVYSNPPTLLPPHPSVVRQWLRNGEVDRLENVVLEGQGHKLLGEYASDLKVRAFLKTVPAYLARIDMVHDAVAKGNATDLKTLLQQAGDGGVSRKKLSSLAMCKDQNGVGLLHKAIYYNYPDIAKWLVEVYPMTVHVRDREKRTPLHYCGACDDPSWMWGLLVDAGAETAVVDAHGHTPAYYMDHPDQLKLPSTAVYMPASRFSNGPIGFVFKPANIRIWIHDRDLGRLQQVVWEGYGDKLRRETSHQPVVKRFLNAVPYIMGTIRDVHTAVINNDLILLKKKTDNPVPNEILTSKDANGLTPMHKAAGLGHTEIVEYILGRCKKTVSIQDHEGRTPLHYAAALKDDGEIYTLLKESVADEETLDKKRRPASYYMQKPNEIDTKVLRVIPEAPRTANIYPPTWDWRLLTRDQDSALSRGRPTVASTNGDSAFEDMATDDTPDKHTPQDISEVPELERDTEIIEDAYESQTYESEMIHGYDAENGEHVEESDETETRDEQAVTEDVNENQDNGGDEEERKEDGENMEGEGENQEKSNGIVEETQNEDEEEDESTLVENDNEGNNEDQETRINEDQEIGNDDKETEYRNGVGRDVDDDEDDDEMEENTEEEERDRNEDNLTPASENENDERIKEIVDRGVIEELAELVLNGEGDLLLRHRSDNPDIQLFLNNVPNYMAKIKTVHTAACEGNLRALQSALDRRKFAVSRENHSLLRVTPLHMATLYGRTSILRFLAGRFPETLHARDAKGRTPLHYAATLNDNGHFYNLLITLGADRNLEDDDGKSAEYYLRNPEYVTHKQLLAEFENRESGDGEEDNPDVQLMDQGIFSGRSGDSGDTVTVGTETALVREGFPVFSPEEGQYLASSLGEPLIKGLTEVANRRPDDPVGYLGNYLLTFANRPKDSVPNERQASLTISDVPEEQHEVIDSDERQKNSEEADDNDDNVNDNVNDNVLSRASTANDNDNNELEAKSPEPLGSAFKPTNRDEFGQTILHFAMARTHGRNAVFQLLQELDCNIGYRDELYRTARDVAVQVNIPDNMQAVDKYVVSLAATGETEKLKELLMEGYDHILDTEDEGINILDVTTQRNQTTAQSFLQSITSFEDRRERLHRAIRMGSETQVEEMLRAGNNGSMLALAKNAQSRCSLHIAVLSQNEKIVQYIVSLFPQTLLVGDNLMRTALHYAMAVDSVESISGILIRAGAKRVVKDLKGRQPSYYFMNKSEIQKLQDEEDALRI